MARKKTAVEMRFSPIAELHDYENNARTHSDAQIDEIVASIIEFGFAGLVSFRK